MPSSVALSSGFKMKVDGCFSYFGEKEHTVLRKMHPTFEETSPAIILQAAKVLLRQQLTIVCVYLFS